MQHQRVRHTVQQTCTAQFPVLEDFLERCSESTISYVHLMVLLQASKALRAKHDDDSFTAMHNWCKESTANAN